MKTGSKIKWIAALIGVIVMAFSIFGHGVVHTEIVIPASPAEVWAVLTDGPGYKDWNPVLVPVEGQLKQRQTLKYLMTDNTGKQSEVKSKVIEMIDEKKLNQFGGMRGILTFDHQWLLEPVEGGTKVIQHEEYRGIGVWFWDYSWVEPAYTKANEALKKRVLETVE